MVSLFSFSAPALSPQQDVQQVLHFLGLQRFFANVEDLAEQEAQRYAKANEKARAWGDAGLGAADLQARLDVLLLQQYEPQHYRKLIGIFSRPELAPIIQSCHGEGLEDSAVPLASYQQQLQRQPARSNRVSLAQELDKASRTSKLASQLYSRVEQRIYLLSHADDAPAVRWEEVLAEREAVFQAATETWYLYCGRYFQDELLQALIDSYRQPAVQRWLDQYQAALDKVLPFELVP
jgi:hypothetical protein